MVFDGPFNKVIKIQINWTQDNKKTKQKEARGTLLNRMIPFDDGFNGEIKNRPTIQVLHII